MYAEARSREAHEIPSIESAPYMADYVDAEHRHCSRRICLGKGCGLQARTDRWTVWSGYVSRTSAFIEKRPVAVRLANFTENARPYRDSKDRYHVLGENGASVLS